MGDFLIVGNSGLAEEAYAIDESQGAADGNKIIKTKADGTISDTFLGAGIGADEVSRVAGEALSANAIVRILSDGTVVNADASLGLVGRGIAFATTAAADGESVVIQFDNTISGLSGLSTGETYFLSATDPGQITTDIPDAGSGHIIQPVGYAISETELSFEPGEPILRA